MTRTSVQARPGLRLRIQTILSITTNRVDCGDCGKTIWQFGSGVPIGDGKDGWMPTQTHKFNDNGTVHSHAEPANP